MGYDLGIWLSQKLYNGIQKNQEAIRGGTKNKENGGEAYQNRGMGNFEREIYQKT